MKKFRLMLIIALSCALGVSFSVQAVQADVTVSNQGNIVTYDWIATSFYGIAGDKIIATWNVPSNTIDIFLLDENNYALFIQQNPSYNPLIYITNTSYGFFIYNITQEGCYFTVFYANYSTAYTWFQVTLVEQDSRSTLPTNNLISGFSLFILTFGAISAVFLIIWQIKKKK